MCVTNSCREVAFAHPWSPRHLHIRMQWDSNPQTLTGQRFSSANTVLSANPALYPLVPQGKVLKFLPILDTIILAHTLYTASYTAQLVGNSLLPRSAKSTVTVRTAYRRLHSLSVPSGPSSTRLNRSQRTALKLTGAATVQLFNLPSGYCTSM